MLCFVIYPFVCRQRFFYYLFGFIYCDVLKNIIKLALHMPRPLWLWPDLQCYGAERTLAAPSGHTTRATFVTIFLILDLFCASGNSRLAYPSSNSRSLQGKHLYDAAIILVVGMSYFSVLVYFVFFMGAHSLDQLFLGTQFGIWASLYLHYGWRDLIHDHISYIMHVPRLAAQKAYNYLTVSSIVFGFTVALIYLELIWLRATWIIP